jgi:hypothetical protein
MPPSREDFTRWLGDSVTAYVMRAHLAMAETNKAEWLRVSWEAGHANPALLSELRTRADAYRAIAEMTYDALCDANGDEPNED